MKQAVIAALLHDDLLSADRRTGSVVAPFLAIADVKAAFAAVLAYLQELRRLQAYVVAAGIGGVRGSPRLAAAAAAAQSVSAPLPPLTRDDALFVSAAHTIFAGPQPSPEMPVPPLSADAVALVRALCAVPTTNVIAAAQASVATSLCSTFRHFCS